jgi:hypothetical protein
MSSIFKLHERVRRLRGALSYLTKATASDSAELRSALHTRADKQACKEWTELLAEAREYLSAAETLAPLRKRPAKSKRRLSPRSRPASRRAPARFDARATIH